MNKNIWLPLIMVLVLLPLILGVIYTCSILPASNPGTTQTPTTTLTTSTNPGTSTTTSSAVLDGQTIYNQNCLNCHNPKPQVSNYSQDQLSIFLSGHRSGTNLTAEEISALVALLKP